MQPTTRSIQKTDRSAWWADARFGMFIHWGLYAIPARGEWVRSQERLSDLHYNAYLQEFDPRRYHPREWAQIAKRAGMRYAVLTAKHHDGFCLFPSKLTSYHAMATPAKRDLVREFVDAFREAGLRVGFYYSLLDWHHEHYPVDRLHPLRDDADARAKPRDFGHYQRYLHGQVRELLANYGRIDLLWLDFSYDDMSGQRWLAAELVDLVRGLQPHILLNNRLVAGHEDPGRAAQLGDFATPEQTIPERGLVDAEGQPLPWEACLTLNDHWGYCRNDRNWKSAAQVVHALVECVSKSGNLLLNVGPDALGEIPEASTSALAAVGRWMDRNERSIVGCGAIDLPKPEWGRLTADGKGRIYAHVLVPPIGPISIRGIGAQVRRARLLHDGSEVDIRRPWNAPADSPDLYLSFGGPLPDPIDTVVEIELLRP